MEPYENNPHPLVDIDEHDLQETMPDDWVALRLLYALEAMRNKKPNDRSEKDRRYAVAITELEKVRAYFDLYVLREGDQGL